MVYTPCTTSSLVYRPQYLNAPGRYQIQDSTCLTPPPVHLSRLSVAPHVRTDIVGTRHLQSEALRHRFRHSVLEATQRPQLGQVEGAARPWDGHYTLQQFRNRQKKRRDTERWRNLQGDVVRMSHMNNMSHMGDWMQ